MSKNNPAQQKYKRYISDLQKKHQSYYLHFDRWEQEHDFHDGLELIWFT